MAAFIIVDFLSVCVVTVGGGLLTLRAYRVGKGREVALPFIMMAFFFLALIVLVMALDLLAVSSTSNASQLVLFTIVIFTTFAGFFAVILITDKTLSIGELKRVVQNLADMPDSFSAEKNTFPQEYRNKVLQGYRNNILKDTKYTAIQTPEMPDPLNLRSIFIKLQVELVKSNKYMRGKSSSSIDPLQAIEDHKRCVFLGAPGSGKTTLLKSLLLSKLEPEKEHKKLLPMVLPIFVSLHDFVSSDSPDLLEYIIGQLVNEGYPTLEVSPYIKGVEYIKGNERITIEGLLKEGNVLLLLDALDEAYTGGDKANQTYERVVQNIQQIVEAYHKISIVVTVRKAAYHQLMRLSDFVEYNVKPFGPDDIREFVLKQFDTHLTIDESDNAGNPYRLISIIENDRRIEKLVSNPFFLYQTVQAFKGRLNPVGRQAILYKNCVELLLSRKWDASRAITRSSLVNEHDERQVLQYVAFCFHQKKQSHFTKKELVSTISEGVSRYPLIDPTRIKFGIETILNVIVSENGLLSRDEHGKYEFLYPLFQEYFAARFLVEYPDKVAVLYQNLHSFWWETVILFYAAFTPKIKDLLGQMTNQSKNSDDSFDSLAGHCLGAAIHMPQGSIDARFLNEGPGKQIVNDLHDRLKNTPYSVIRNKAAKALVDIQAPGILNDLQRMIQMAKQSQPASTDKVKNLAIAKSIIKALADLGESYLLFDAYDLLNNYSSFEPAEMEQLEAIARYVGELDCTAHGIKEMVFLLTENAAYGPANRCYLMVEALAGTRKGTAAEPLLSILENHEIEQDEILCKIVDAAIKLNKTNAIPRLLELLLQKKGGVAVRRHIAEMIGYSKDGSVADGLLDLLNNTEVEQTKKLEPEVHYSVVNALGDLQMQGIAEKLNAYYLKKKNETDTEPLCSFIAASLGKLKRADVVPVLTSFLDEMQRPKPLAQLNAQDTNVWLGTEVVEALGILDKYVATSYLLMQLYNERQHKQIRKRLAAVLGKRVADKQEIAAKLSHWLKDNTIDEEVRQSMAAALGELRYLGIVSTLIDLLKDQDISSKVRQSIAESVKKLIEAEDSSKMKQWKKALTGALRQVDGNTDVEFRDAIHQALWMVSRRLEIQELPESIKVRNERS